MWWNNGQLWWNNKLYRFDKNLFVPKVERKFMSNNFTDTDAHFENN